MWASLCVSSVCMHLSSVSVSLPPLRALSLGPGPGPAGLCLRVPLTLVPLPLAVRAGPRSDALAQAVHPQPAAANVQDVAGLEPQAAAAFAAKAPPEVREGTGPGHRGKGACVKVGRCVVDGEDIGPAGEAVDDGMQVAAGRCRLVAVEFDVEDAPAADGEGVSNARVWTSVSRFVWRSVSLKRGAPARLASRPHIPASWPTLSAGGSAAGAGSGSSAAGAW